MIHDIELYVKTTNVTIKHVKNGTHRIANVQTHANVRQNA